MSAKRALIVDDSNSARIVLSRMLQKYSIDVDTAESAESAIAYLTHHRPDVIFMDHLMPGMDGFQAVQAIKNNPRTATIPIMMYTSQEGELYVGQARALGAVGVLPKLVKPVDVSKVLYQLHLLPERRDSTPPAFVAVNPTPATPSPQAADLVPADWHPQLESALRNHDAELRRFVVATLDSFADRITSDVRNWMSEAPALQDPPPAPAQARPHWWIAGVLAALLTGVVSTGLYLRTIATNRSLAAENTRLQQANSQLALAAERSTEIQAAQEKSRGLPAGTSAASPGAPPLAAPPSSSDWRVEPVPYGEPPLALGRVDALREFLARLDQQSFTGIVRATAYRGRFCLSGNATEGYALASEELPAAKCDLIGNPFDGALNSAQRQSLAFANLASSARLRTNGAISVVVNDEPVDTRVVAPYPSAREGVTAGQWNEIAARNNRVELTTAPKPSTR
jgi:CheY-like chemotaxis protein